MIGERRFRFGVQVAEAPSGAVWAERARRVEALGYDLLVMPDHIGIQWAYAPALAAAASATTRLRIGTLVLATDFRDPVTVANDAATLDRLSDGRYELGLRVGGSLLADYRFVGREFEPPSVRVGRFIESVRVVKGLFAEGAVSFAGRHLRVHELIGFPRPVQRPHPPILIGAGGPRMLAVAAREADIVSILPAMSPTGQFALTEARAAALDDKVALIRRVAGARFADLELHLLVQGVAITAQPDEEAARIAARWGLTIEDIRESPLVLLGTVEEIVATLRARRARFGVSYYTIFDHDMERFAPVVAALAGG